MAVRVAVNILTEAVGELRSFRPRADQAHVPPQDVDQLGQLVQRGLPQEAADVRAPVLALDPAGSGVGGELEPVRAAVAVAVVVAVVVAVAVAVGAAAVRAVHRDRRGHRRRVLHAAELEDLEVAPIQPHAALTEEDLAAHREPGRDREADHDGRDQQQQGFSR